MGVHGVHFVPMLLKIAATYAAPDLHTRASGAEHGAFLLGAVDPLLHIRLKRVAANGAVHQPCAVGKVLPHLPMQIAQVRLAPALAATVHILADVKGFSAYLTDAVHHFCQIFRTVPSG